MTVTHEITVDSTNHVRNPKQYASCAVAVIARTHYSWGDDYATIKRRVQIDKLPEALEKLHAQYPGCSHRYCKRASN